MDTIEVTVTCMYCRNDTILTVPKQGYINWANGELIQRAMPNLSSEDRELLISHTCPICWDKMFSDSED